MKKLRSVVAIVDDEETIRKALKRLLRSAGIVVLDIGMQGMTGFDVQARLKAARVVVPVIFITALDDPGDEARAMDAGAIAFLRKPFDDEALLAAIGAVARPAPTTPRA